MMFALPLLFSVVGGTSIGASDPQCEVAGAYVESVLARWHAAPVIFTRAPVHWDDKLWSYPRWIDSTTGKPGLAPSTNLLASLHRDGATSAFDNCSVIQTSITERHIAFGDEAVAKAVEPLQNGDLAYRGEIIGISLPIVSANGTEAVLASSDVSGPLAGGTRLVYLRRSVSSPWRIVSALLPPTS